MKLTIDFESRSVAKLGLVKSVGAWRYSEDPSTRIFCLAVKPDNRKPYIWIAPWVIKLLDKAFPSGKWTDHFPTMINFADLVWHINNAETIEAHNAGFEQALWENIMRPQYGAPEIKIRRWRCSLAKCLYHALPAGLGKVCEVLGLPEQKDKEGKALIKKLCSPRAIVKTDKEDWLIREFGRDSAIVKKMKVADMDKELDRLTGGDWRNRILWDEDPESIIRIMKYCIQDDEAEYGLSEALPDLPESEQVVWSYDQLINRRGVRVDVEAARTIMKEVVKYKARLKEEAANVYGLDNVNSDVQFKAWMGANGIKLENVQKQTLIDLLEEGVPPHVERMIKIRQVVSRAATSKLEAMDRCACKDDRLRGTTIYHKAAPGRWAGALVQVQNLPRDSFDDPLEYVNELRKDPELAEMLYGDPVSNAAKCVRGLFVPRDGCEFICADYKSIEGRVLAWLAGEESALKVYRDGKDAYKFAASAIYGKTYDEITKPQRQIGKVAELACGYQGSVGAFHSMAQVYGVKVPDEEAKKIVEGWRTGRPRTVQLWAALEAGVKEAIRSPGRVMEYRGLRMQVKGAFLLVRLPSGRLLHYFKPHLTRGIGNFPEKETIAYWGMKQTDQGTTTRWCLVGTYGGKLTENFVQAIARDLLAAAMPRVERAGFPIVLHVHDELLTEPLISAGKTVQELETLMSVRPDWAATIPVEADGWKGMRYRK